jgi:hypothetical protein
MFRELPRQPRDPKEREQERLAKARQLHSEVARILTAAQRQRLQEIVRQLQGPMAFSQSDVVEALGLTPAQQENIQTTLKRSFSGDCKPGQPLDSADKATTQDKILQTLTQDQRHKWADLTGRPFEGQIRSFTFGLHEWHGPDHHHKGGPGGGPRPPVPPGEPPPDQGH